MRTELLGQEKNIVRVKVEFEAADFMANLSEIMKDITQKANIPGFRKGHTPRRIVEMRFGKDNLHKEALEKMLPKALKKITEDYDLNMMDTPDLKIDDIREGEPVTCELTIEVMPEVELPELGDIEVERLNQEVTDEAVDTMVGAFRKNLATLTPVDRAAGENDVVSASFVTQILNADGSEDIPAGDPTPSNIDLSEPSVKPEVRDALLGKSKGDNVSTEFEIEQDYRDAALAGKKVYYEIKVDEVNEKILPEMNPEFFKKVMNVDLETEADFRSEMKKRLLEHQEAEEMARVTDEAVEAIVGRSKLEVPDTLVERQIAYVKEQDAADIKQRYNISMEDYLSNISFDEDQYEQAVRGKAHDTLRRTLVLDEVGKKFGIEVKREEVDAEISRQAAMHGMERAKLRAHYYKNEENMSRLSNKLFYDKVGQSIMENIKIKHVDKLSGKADEANESAEAANAE